MSDSINPLTERYNYLESIKVCFCLGKHTLSVNDYEILIEGSLTHGAWNLHDFLLTNLGHFK